MTTSAWETHGALSRGAFAGAVLASFAVLFAPASDVPGVPPGVDKVVHGLLFAALALSGRWAGIVGRILAGLLIVYAAISELVQELTPLARTGSLADWLADVVGVVLGLAAWRLLSRSGLPVR